MSRSFFTVSLLLSLFLCVSVVVGSAQNDASSTFDQYVKDYGKKYSGPEEYAFRKRLFSTTFRRIRDFNSQPGHSYRKSINIFSDWTREEYEKILQNTGPIPPSPTSNVTLQAKAVEELTSHPDSFTWQNHTPSILTPVKDDFRKGTSWAFAATEAVESMFALKRKKLLVLSTEQVVACASSKKADAALQRAWDYIRENDGITLNTTYPSRQGSDKCLFNRSFMPTPVTVNSYTNVSVDDGSIISALLEHGPLVVFIDASKLATYGGGIFTPTSSHGACTGNHMAQLVGYTPTYWIIRNSWGSSWGENGYLRLSRAIPAPLAMADGAGEHSSSFAHHHHHHHHHHRHSHHKRGHRHHHHAAAGTLGFARAAAPQQCNMIFAAAYPYVDEPLTPGGQYAWVAGVVFAVLILLMGGIMAVSFYRRRRKTAETTLLDEEFIQTSQYSAA